MDDKKLLDNFEYASFNRRIFSSTIDVLIIALLLTPITNLLDFLLYNNKGLAVMIGEFFKSRNNTVSSEELWQFLSENHILTKYFFVQFVLFLMIGLFFVGFWNYKGQTPGKMITRCKIADARSGATPTMKQCITRFFSYVPSTLLLCIGFIMASFTKRKQGLHDMIANTIVILDKRPSGDAKPVEKKINI